MSGLNLQIVTQVNVYQPTLQQTQSIIQFLFTLSIQSNDIFRWLVKILILRQPNLLSKSMIDTVLLFYTSPNMCCIFFQVILSLLKHGQTSLILDNLVNFRNNEQTNQKIRSCTNLQIYCDCKLRWKGLHLSTY